MCTSLKAGIVKSKFFSVKSPKIIKDQTGHKVIKKLMLHEIPSVSEMFANELIFSCFTGFFILFTNYLFFF